MATTNRFSYDFTNPNSNLNQFLQSLQNVGFSVDKNASLPQFFPLQIIKNVSSAAMFFCAGFGGLYDVIHVYNNTAIKDVSLIDNHSEKMQWMQKIYPNNWSYFTEDAFVSAENFLQQGKEFNLVCCDPYSGLIPDIFINKFNLFFKLTNKYLVANYARSFDHLFHPQFDLKHFASYLSDIHKQEIKISNITFRSNFLGGLYWIVIEK